MSIAKLLKKTIASEQLGELDTSSTNQEIDDLANKFVKIMNKKEITTSEEINKAKKNISRKLDEECERSSQLSKALIDQIKKAIFMKIDEKFRLEIKTKKNLKINKKREIVSSDEEPFKKEEQLESEDYDEEEEKIKCPPKTKTIKKDRGEKNQKKNIRKRKYETFDQEFKEEVCVYAEKFGGEEAAEKYGLSLRKVLNWVEAHQLNVLGKGRKALDPIMQYNISIWILRKIWDQIPLTQKIIRQKAATLKTLSKPFNGSKGWLQKFFLRHVQLKSCFDIRNKLQQRIECVRYHQCAFERLLKDCQNLVKSGQNTDLIVQGNLQRIIYFKEDHPLLKFKADKNLDKHKIDSRALYEYDRISQIAVKKLEEDEKDEEDEVSGQSLQLKSSANIVTKSQEQEFSGSEEEEQEDSEQVSYKQEEYYSQSEEQSHKIRSKNLPVKKQQQMYSSDVKYEIFEGDSSSEQEEASKKLKQEQSVKKCEEEDENNQ